MFANRWLAGGLVLILAAVMAAAVSSCGGGTASAGGAGRVAVLLADAPIDDFRAVNVTISRVELLGEDGRRALLYSGSRTVNLLDLQSSSDLFGIADDIPAGVYEKIRLVITAVELLPKDPAAAPIAPKLPANGKIDLNPRAHFTVTPGETLVLQIDLDARKSIHLVEQGSGAYHFRPVVFVDIVSGGTVLGKFVKLAGTVSGLDAGLQRFDLCDVETSFHRHDDGEDDDHRPIGSATREDDGGRADEDRDGSDRDDGRAPRGCVAVEVDGETALFTAAGPAAFDGLQDGAAVTVIGRIDDGRRDLADHLTLHALVVQIGPPGTFARIEGRVTAAYDAGTGQFTLQVEEGLGAGTSLTVDLLDGAYIFGAHGRILAPRDIAVGAEAKVSGVPVASGPLGASVVFLDELRDDHRERLDGTIGGFAPQSRTFTLQSNQIGDVCLKIKEDAGIYKILSDASGQVTAEIRAAELADGLRVDVYGRFEHSGCFEARDIIAAEY